jgi:hypothetical protein
MRSKIMSKLFLVALLSGFSTLAGAQAFRVQCPAKTSLHPSVGTGSPTSPGAAYNGPVTINDTGTGGDLPFGLEVCGIVFAVVLVGG